MFLLNWTTFIEVSLLVLFVVAAIVVSSVFMIRSVTRSYKEVFKYQSKLDIELRKIINLLSKVIKDELLAETDKQNVKELPFAERKKLILHVEELFQTIDPELEENKYLIETYENLHEFRRRRDALALIFNQKVSMFPFNIYMKILKLKKWNIFTK